MRSKATSTTEDDMLGKDDVTFDNEQVNVRVPDMLLRENFELAALEEEESKVREHYKTAYGPERYYRIGTKTLVCQSSLDPPCFIMFYGSPRLLRPTIDLYMPCSPEHIWYSLFVRAGDYILANGSAYKDYQRYTVELFGLRVPWPLLDTTYANLKRTYPGRYRSRPDYWAKSSTEIIQIWRTRVLHCTLEDLKLSPSNPLSPYDPAFPYFEDSWHPQKPRNRLRYCGFQYPGLGFKELKRFHSKVRKILLRKPVRMGRPFGSGRYPNVWEFFKAARQVHDKLWETTGKKPGQKEVAWKLGFSPESFKYYWRLVDRHWKNLPPPESLRSKGKIRTSNSLSRQIRGARN